MSAAVFVGERVAGRYALHSEIGRGGHGVVFAAIDEHTGQRVAVKVLNYDLADNDQYVLRLWREAESLAALMGSSVVQVHEFDTDPRGFVYLVMEFLQGEPLDVHLYDREAFGHRMSPSEVIEVLDPVAHALALAHQKGIIHRDIKPPNIFLVDRQLGGGTRLMDFGLAKTADFEEITDSGMIAGSPSYIAPEIWHSEPFDHRCDVYSFGAVIFRALAGRPPFEAPSTLDLYRVATRAERPRLTSFRPDLTPMFDTWVQHALAISLHHRYPSIERLWLDFQHVVAQSGRPSVRSRPGSEVF